jgi:hypothetical protein
MEKETIEEAVNKEFPLDKCYAEREAMFVGVKWQQERSYSEEQVISLLDRFGDHIDEWYSNGFNTETETTEKWFNKHKNVIK